MKIPIDVAQTVVEIAYAIYQQVQLVKANKSQCERLATRIKIVEQALRQAKKIPSSKHYESGLQMLYKCLTDTLDFIKQFGDRKKWYQKAVYAQKNQARFAELNEQLQACLPLLNLGMMLHQLKQQEEDALDKKADSQALRKGQEEILSLNKRMWGELQALKGAEAKREVILSRQLASLRRALQPGDIKPLIEARDRISYFELTFAQLISQEGVSELYQGKWRDLTVAIKLFNVELSDSAEFGREVKIMSRLRHPNIVQFYGACLEENHACIVMEYMEGRSLVDFMAESKLSPVQQRQIALDMGKGLQHLHLNHMIHRNLKSLNILLTRDGRAKIADLGFVKTQTHSIESIHGKINQAIAWCAPELLAGEESITDKVDVYSFGTILWEIFSGKPPFAGLSLADQCKKILAGEREQIPTTWPESICQLIQKCWLVDPVRRPEMIEINQGLEKYVLLDEKQLCQQGKLLDQEKKYAESEKSYQRAADLGSLSALNSLGLCAIKPKGGSLADQGKAYAFFLKAAQNGHFKAMRNVAVMLDSGNGVKADPGQALIWYERAGDADSLVRAKRLREKLANRVNEVSKAAVGSNIPGMI